MDIVGKQIKCLAKTMLVCGFTSAMGVSPLFAQTNTDNLADLINPTGTYHSLTIDDKTFSGFNYLESGLTSFDPTNIIVTASLSGGIDYITWSGNISVVSGGFATADLKLNYIVRANAGAISMIDQAYTGSAQNGFLAIDETAAIGSFGGTVAGSSHLTGLIPSNPPSYSNDLLNIIPPETELYVTKDIAYAVESGGGFVTVSQVAQSFHQVPEPSTLALAGLSGLSLLLFRRQRK
jgi:hypothetical protein